MLRYKLLANQLKAAKHELEISNQIALSAAKKIESMFASHLVEKGELPHREETHANHNKEKKVIKEPTKLIKQLFRKVAIKIHPDKLVHLEGTPEGEQKKELYQNAHQAYEEGDLIILLDIVSSLKITLPKIDEIDLVNEENKIRSIKKQIEELHSTLVWKWNMTYNKVEKEAILNKLFELLYERHKNKNPRA